ncbi:MULTISPECIES: hypothetical protein [Flavobacterium]|uniref:Fibronectin type-III domain-containing protein n=1 Tax=Flavobacterium jumunjinense TaxID=998845 RepID=A0ABV5GQ79_9FLAO|nr:MULTISPECIES: hypothetical protein [Flavobacterium]
MKNFFLYLAMLSIISCSQNDDEKVIDVSKKDTNTSNRSPTSASCDTSPYTVNHSFGNTWSRTLQLPATGKFVQESHYVTTEDNFPGSRLFANTVTENINSHLQRSFNSYKAYDPNKTYSQLYASSFQREWTPAEAGAIGQGSIGNIQTQYLTPEKEMWFMTMMWSPGTRPAIDTKFLLSANGKKVVVVAGYETGPRSQSFIGGLTPETHAWLGTNNSSQITVSYLTNQSTPIGPIDCVSATANTPIPVSPANGATNLSLPINFTYTSPVNAGAFRIQISTSNSDWNETDGFTTNSSPNATVIVNASITTNNYYWNETALGSYEGPKAGKTYYYTIRSWDAATGTSKYSAVRTVSTEFGVQPIAPTNATNVNSPVNLSWASSVSGASCRLQISKVNSAWTEDNGFTTASGSTSIVPVNYNTANLLNYTWPNQYTQAQDLPTAGNTYYWTVRLWSASTGTSKYTPVRSFTVN